MSLIKNKLQILVSLMFLGFVGWWFSFQSVVFKQGTSVQWFGGTYGLIALIGSLIGFFAAWRFGGFKTVLGKALVFLSLGLFLQEVGQLVYTYYVYGAKIAVPYPSWGDAAYFSSELSYIIGAVFLCRTAGIKFSLRHNVYRLIAVIVPVALLVLSYAFFLHHHHFTTNKPLTVLLDLGYPLGEAIYISLAITAYLLSFKLIGGLMKGGLLLVIFALFVQYASDFTFLYQTSRNTWIAGRINDLMYLCAYFAMSTAMIKFLDIYKHLKDKTTNQHPAKGAEAI